MIVGHGLDMIELERIAHMVAEHGQRFLDRCYTPAEQAYSADKKRRLEHLAGRFAAKEAVLKAMGTGLAKGIQWTEVEVLRGDQGQPGVKLRGRALEIADELGITRWILSISHTKEAAVASAIAVGDEERGMKDDER